MANRAVATYVNDRLAGAALRLTSLRTLPPDPVTPVRPCNLGPLKGNLHAMPRSVEGTL